ncbi:putative Ig domain-containing protein [bacterium]|nr:putative Ig domain-containing protein [bacterium]
MKMIFFSIFSLFLVSTGFAQAIPTDSLYLGQTPPGDTPKIFNLSVSPKFFAAERVAISNDGKEIYYSELKGYYPVNTPRIKSYSYSDGKWTGPFNLFEGYIAPALSITGDTMYFENTNSETFCSIKKDLNWGNPKRILSKLDSAHYLQVTGKGNYYVSSRPKNTVGVSDWCKIEFNSSDTTAIGLGMPLNTAWDNLDFFVSKDETFMIVATPFGLSISYPKHDGNWTNPRGLGSIINFGLGMWGPFVTPDNKYLFYSTGTKQDYSDVQVYWVRVDGLIDSLKHTNIPPYLKNKINSQNGFVGNPFSFTVPDDTFFDEDGNATFIYSATLINGSPLPSWLSFNALTKTFSGTPTVAGELKILVTATDAGQASGLGAFKLSISTKP